MTDSPLTPYGEELKAKRARAKRAPAKPKRVETHYGRKTLIAALVAAAVAVLDLYMTLRHGVKLPF